MKKLPLKFYQRKDVVRIARELLGKVVVTNIEGIITSGRIVETEAYMAISDKASHSYKGKRTARNEHMYSPAGTAYVYICYGMHQMLNVVTNEKGIPDAVLIRALEPVQGVEDMLIRTGKSKPDNTLTKGPGNVGKALGINKQHSGLLFLDDVISIYEDKNSNVAEAEIGISKRIGIDSAGEDALLPYRFYIKGNKFVSGRPVN
ncbi:DNA-3-methyladenine glycosylase [Ferruginibacter sp. HRS2-29]|uniref:DNA-3-methyladenine glycosylase n=1 Tax=Ferruginibacter sp. HRS2-29 TaxID=2487334 RepID=UPI0020CC32FE|nr:DNA-3-methyladenine glycosylase [Ferruginibacter sp. HRS2-29]MCP9751649.1 DNA-3-methyladenine glycosylase [Ferruginibacter sp. HRS2-29]